METAAAFTSGIPYPSRFTGAAVEWPPNWQPKSMRVLVMPVPFAVMLVFTGLEKIRRRAV